MLQIRVMGSDREIIKFKELLEKLGKLENTNSPLLHNRRDGEKRAYLNLELKKDKTI